MASVVSLCPVISNSSISRLCSAECGCQAEIYNPVCGEGGIQYASPCHAGCMDYNLTENGEKV